MSPQGKELLNKFEGLHNFMQWDRALLTDSGGFQMVSLLELAEITEEGVKFRSPYDGLYVLFFLVSAFAVVLAALLECTLKMYKDMKGIHIHCILPLSDT